MPGERRPRSFEAMTRHTLTNLDGERSPAPVRLQHVTKRYGHILAVDDLSFEIRAGAVTGFLGPNGAGKTTTLRVLLGLAEPTAGRATIFGHRYPQLEDPLGTVGALLETSTFHPWRTARNHLRILARAAGIAGERVDEVLRGVGLADAAGRRVGGFSLGMRQRLGLAAALLGRPRVLILDEPANGLDPEGIRWLRDLVRGYAADGNSVLISSHLLSEVSQTVDDVVIIAGGRTRAQCSLRELEARTTGAVEVRSAQAAQLRGRLAALGIDATATGPDVLSVTGATADAVGEIAALGGIALSGMTTRTSDLEAVFLELTSPTTHTKEAA
jgi:ABC-2 type transport system ATP-binding protein